MAACETPANSAASVTVNKFASSLSCVLPMVRSIPKKEFRVNTEKAKNVLTRNRLWRIISADILSSPAPRPASRLLGPVGNAPETESLVGVVHLRQAVRKDMGVAGGIAAHIDIEGVLQVQRGGDLPGRSVPGGHTGF